MASLDAPDAPAPTTDPGAQPGPPEPKENLNGPQETEGRPLDILFLQDATGSQGPYIKSARSAISDICTKVSASFSLAKGDIRFGLIAFRDHPPQDRSYVTKNFGFTADVERMKKNLAGLTATGGGDGPEASTAALAAALDMEWEEDAVKIVVLITDAPPHGLGEAGDGFANGSPDQNDPLQIVRQMAERGITLYVIACEPSLSRYMHAIDFYRAICQITSGKMVPLLNASQLGDYIVGSTLETFETEKLIQEFQGVILEDVYGQGKPVDEVMGNMQQKMEERKTEIQTLILEDIYNPSKQADANVTVWVEAENLGSAKGKIKPVRAARLKASYAADMAGSDYAYPVPAPYVTHAPRPPPTTSLAGATSPSGGPHKGSTDSRPIYRHSSHRAPIARSHEPTPFGGSWYSPPPPAPAAPAPGVPYSSYLHSGGSAPSYGSPSLSTYGAASAPSPASSTPYASQQMDMSQTRRVVMQSLMRSAKVGPGGVLTPVGEYAGKSGVKFASGKEGK